MVGAFLLASVVAMPAGSLAAAAATRVSVAVGRIHIVPADPAERRAWYLRVGAELADALISAAAERAIAAYHVTSVAAPNGTYSARWRIASGTPADQEQTTFYRLFAGHSGTIGLVGYLLGFALLDSGESAGAHVLRHLGIRTDDLIVEGTLAHLDGASSWHPSAWLSRDNQMMQRCLAAIAYPGAPKMRSIAGCPDISILTP
jgi:hypothetical protein